MWIADYLSEVFGDVEVAASKAAVRLSGRDCSIDDDDDEAYDDNSDSNED